MKIKLQKPEKFIVRPEQFLVTDTLYIRAIIIMPDQETVRVDFTDGLIYEGKIKEDSKIVTDLYDFIYKAVSAEYDQNNKSQKEEIADQEN